MNLPVLLHILPGFGPGGAQSRIVALLNRLDIPWQHVIVSLNGDLRAAERVDSSAHLQTATFRAGRNPAGAFARFVKLIRQYRPQLILTYNWGAIEAVAAASALRLCPVIHTEDGFGDDEALGQKRRRVLTRRLVLRNADRVIAPSKTLRDIMARVWRLPEKAILYIPNGVDTHQFIPPDRERPPATELVVGTAGQLRAEKRLQDLIALCAQVRNSIPVRLRIAGDGPERGVLEAAAKTHNFTGHVEFLGQLKDLRGFYHSLDIFGLTSSTEQMPVSILEAMATGLPVVSTDVGDVRDMISPENSPFIAPVGERLAQALTRLALDRELRQSIGENNRSRCVAQFDLGQMVATYRRLYEETMLSSGP